MIRGLDGILAEHPFFHGMSEAQIALLVGCAWNRRYRAGESIFRQGQDAGEFFLIRQGRVAVELDAADRGRLTLQTLGEGEILGWAWIVPPYVQRFDARAQELTRVVALDGACLRGKFDDDHELGYELLTRFVAVMTQRLEAARLQLLDLYGQPPPRHAGGAGGRGGP